MALEVPFQSESFCDSMWLQQVQNSFKIDFILLSYLMTFFIKDVLRRKRLVTSSSLLSVLKKQCLSSLRCICNVSLEKYVFSCLIHSQSSMEVAILIVQARRVSQMISFNAVNYDTFSFSARRYHSQHMQRNTALHLHRKESFSLPSA